MEITDNDRLLLIKGLDWLIEMKQLEIKQIQNRTEEDYEVAKRFEHLLSTPFNLEVAKERGIQKADNERKQILQLRKQINRSDNHLLIVPSFIKLQLTNQ